MNRDRMSFSTIKEIIDYLEIKQTKNSLAPKFQNNIWIAKNYSVADLYSDLQYIYKELYM